MQFNQEEKKRVKVPEEKSLFNMNCKIYLLKERCIHAQQNGI
jgi:hypothetical protein